MRRLHVRGHENVLKRLLIQVSAFNLGMLMRQSLGVGTPRGLQGRICALMLLILSLFKRLKGLFGLIPAAWPEKPNSATPSLLPSVGNHLSSENVLLPRAARGVTEQTAWRAPWTLHADYPEGEHNGDPE